MRVLLFLFALSLCFISGRGLVIHISPTLCNNTPCASPLDWAQQFARSAVKHGPVTVRMSLGEYAIARPLQLNALDSGVNWIGPANITGFIEVVDWTLNVTSGLWSAPLPSPFSAAMIPSQLFVNGLRRVRARLPTVVGGEDRNVTAAYSAPSCFSLSPLSPCTGEVCPPVDFTGFVFNASDPRLDVNVLRTGADVLMFHRWSACRAPITAVFPHNSTVFFEPRCTYAAGSSLGSPARGEMRWIVEGHPALLGSPGEWAVDPVTATVSYVPLPGEIPGTNGTRVQLPAIPTLLNVSGDSIYSPARNLRFQGISFSGSSDDGSVIGERFAVHGMVQIAFAENITLFQCSISGGGGNGLQIGPGVVGFSADRNDIYDLGGHGVYVEGEVSVKTNGGNNATNVSLTNNVVADVGLIYLAQPTGIMVNGKDGILVAHNDVTRSTYAGIQLVWLHGGPPPPSNAAPRYNISFNRVHNYGMSVLSDFGGIRVAVDADDDCWNSTEPSLMCWLPAIVDSNYISGGRHASYGSDGIYTDQATAGVTFTNNIIADVGAAAIHQHCGANMTYRNNILFSAAQQQEVGNTSPWPLYGALFGCSWRDYDPPAPISMFFQQNIVLITAGGVAVQRENVSTQGLSVFDRNVYFAKPDAGSAAVLLFPLNSTWIEWRAAGNDADSVCADPLLADPFHGNFTVLSGSPAWALGWKAINTAAIGPQGGV